MKPWLRISSDGDEHVLLLHEENSHQLTRQCQCGPRFQSVEGDQAWQGDDFPLIVIHTSSKKTLDTANEEK